MRVLLGGLGGGGEMRWLIQLIDRPNRTPHVPNHTTTNRVAALTRRLDWISAPHHKAWAVLHHLVHHGDVPLLERVVGIPGAFAAIKLHRRTRDCKRTVAELAMASSASGEGEEGEKSPMARYLRQTLGPMFGWHGGGEGGGGAGGAFPRVRAVAAGNVKVGGEWMGCVGGGVGTDI